MVLVSWNITEELNIIRFHFGFTEQGERYFPPPLYPFYTIGRAKCSEDMSFGRTPAANNPASYSK